MLKFDKSSRKICVCEKNVVPLHRQTRKGADNPTSSTTKYFTIMEKQISTQELIDLQNTFSSLNGVTEQNPFGRFETEEAYNEALLDFTSEYIHNDNYENIEEYIYIAIQNSNIENSTTTERVSFYSRYALLENEVIGAAKALVTKYGKESEIVSGGLSLSLKEFSYDYVELCVTDGGELYFVNYADTYIDPRICLPYFIEILDKLIDKYE